ncbi:MAG TPA: NHL repeat-containing protein, partial [Chloroflexota bacterium]
MTRHTFSGIRRLVLLLVVLAAVCQPVERADAAAQWQVVYPQRAMPFFHQGTGIGVDRGHNIYVLDQLEAREYKFSAEGKRLDIWPVGQPVLARQWNPSHLAVDSQGTSYVLGNGVTKLSSSGKLLSHWSIGRSAASIAVGGSGNVFLLLLRPAPTGIGGSVEIDKLSPAGALLSTWVSPVIQSQSVAPDGLAVDPAGNVYATAGTDNQCYKACIPVTSVLFRFSSSGHVTRVFHPGSLEFGPIAAVDSQGTLYLLPHDVSFASMSLERMSATGKVLSIVSRVGTDQLGDTLHLALDDQRIYLTDSRVFDQSTFAIGGVVRVLSNTGKSIALWGRFLSKTSVPLNLGIAVGPSGNIYLSGGPNSAAYSVVSPAGRLLQTVGSTQGSGAVLSDARSLRVDSKGNVYVLDGISGRIAKFSPGGKLLARWSLPGAPTIGGDDLALDSSGNVYVTAPSVIFKLSPSGKLLATIGGPGTGPGRFGGPGGLALDSSGNIFVADVYNNRIQELSPTGTPIAAWSSPRGFDRPIRVALDTAGDVYVVDLTHDYVQQFTHSGRFVAVLSGPGIWPGQLIEPTSL